MSRSLYPLATLGLILLLWGGSVWVFDIAPFILPSPLAVAKAIADNAGTLMPALAYTLGEVLLGFGLSVLVGGLIALAIVSSDLLDRSVYPLLVALQIVPKVAIAPLFAIWFGFGMLPKVLMAFLIAFFPMVINTAMGLRGIEVSKLHLARSMGASGLQTFFKIRLPHAMPSIFTGLKLSITSAMIGAIVGEFIGSDEGVGRILLVANGNMQTDLLFAGVVLLSLAGVVLFLAIEAIERATLSWHISQRSRDMVMA
ncbi:ABC transporter permease [Sphingomonas crocodyli]|uniref:ABC transporter permease n=1 Tax=Sphingomonas crocodyli TaxID=1979270 RepID=A0A437M0C5_9SPHN|nr:ABC transporter permease [Sphingomonas crocodyli]RVT90964.1 ABC transporter permease [Sphingomonas crocodyli]